MKSVPAKGIAAIFGGILITLTTGSYQTFGNLEPYLVSYVRKHGLPKDLDYSRYQFVFAVMMVTENIFMIISSYIERKVGFHLTVIFGLTSLTFGWLLTAFTVSVHYYLVILTYAVCSPIGLGVTLTNIAKNAAKWFPGHEGVVAGLSTIGLGSSSLVLSPLQLVLINPENEVPNRTSHNGSELYFEQDTLLQRVPGFFVKQALIFACLQAVGFLCLFEKGDSESEEGSVVADKDRHTADDDLQPLVPTKDVTIKEAAIELLSSKLFWIILLSLCFSCASTVFILVNFKPYGQTFHLTDSYLTMIWSVSSISAGIGRIGGGYLMDVRSIKFGIVLNCILQCVICLFLGLWKAHQIPIVYCLLVNGMAVLQNSLITFFQVDSWRRFRNFDSNLSVGLVFIGWSLGNLLGLTFGFVIMNYFDWQFTFQLIVFFPLTGILLICLLPTKHER